jgi:hypothetical protein
MRNKILFFLITCFLFSDNISFGQCPAPVANYPDSACSGVPILFSNTTVGSNLISEWDFNTSENYNNPVGSLVLNNPANLVSSLGLDLVFDNSQYYAFSINTSGNLTRFDFGNSYENNPTINALGNLGILSNCGDIRILSNNGNWFGFINTFSNQVIRLNFGNNLINIPTATALNLSASLFSTPYYIDIEKIGNNFIGIISNYSGGNITVIDFGNDLQNNNPNGFNISVPFSNPISAAITMDCGEIYAIVGYASGYSPVLINFGTTVSATPNSITPLNSSLAMSYSTFPKNILFFVSNYYDYQKKLVSQADVYKGNEIYMIIKGRDNKWNLPINCGNVINTDCDETVVAPPIALAGPSSNVKAAHASLPTVEVNAPGVSAPAAVSTL